MFSLNLNPEHLIAQKLTSLFEQSTFSMPINNITDENDGRGFTVGWAGFTTADEEPRRCIETYIKLVGENGLSGDVLDTIKRSQGNHATQALNNVNFKAMWKDACSNPSFQDAFQLTVSSIFGVPAQKYCDDYNFVFPISFAILFDSLIQHGNGNDPDSVPSMISSLNLGSSDDEKVQMSAFLDERHRVLSHPNNTDTQVEWAASVGRVDSLRHILNTNRNLKSPINFNWEHSSYSL